MSVNKHSNGNVQKHIGNVEKDIVSVSTEWNQFIAAINTITIIRIICLVISE